MKYLHRLVIATVIALSNSAGSTLAAQDKNIDFGNVDKKVEGWKYVLNGKEVSYLPEIYLVGSAKYIPVEIVRSLGASLVIDSPNRTAYLTNNDESFIIKENSKQIYVNNKNFLIQEEPIWKNNTLYVSTKFLLRLGILISEDKLKNEINIIKNFNIINDFKTNIDNTENKIIFSLNSLPVYVTESGKNYYKVTFFGTMIKEPDKFKKQLENISSDFKKVDLDISHQGIINIIFHTKGDVGIVNTYYLEKPQRLVVQFPKIYKDQLKESVSSGFVRTKIAEGTYQGPLRINLLEANLNKNLTIKPMVSRDENMNFTVREVSRFTKDFNAVAGINGGYYSLASKFPLGLLIINGELVSAPIYNRSALIINRDNTFSVKNVDLSIFLNLFDPEGATKSIKINAFNLPPQKNQMVLFTYNYGKNNLNKSPKGAPVYGNTENKSPKGTPVYGNTENKSPKGTPVYGNTENKKEKTEIKEEEKEPDLVDPVNQEIKVNKEPEPEFTGYLLSRRGEGLSKLKDFNSNIPQRNFVLYASGSAKDTLEKLSLGTSRYELEFNYSEPVDNILYAIGGGPALIKEGNVNITAKAEKFKADISDGQAPRSAFAILKTGRVLLATVDGRQANSKGMTLEELANFLQLYDAREAINFDGGGSSTMVLNGKVINSFSDPRERKVSNSLMIFHDKK